MIALFILFPVTFLVGLFSGFSLGWAAKSEQVRTEIEAVKRDLAISAQRLEQAVKQNKPKEGGH